MFGIVIFPLLPLPDGECDDALTLRIGNLARHAYKGVATKCLRQSGHHPVVAVRRLDKNLCHAAAPRLRLKLAHPFPSLILPYRQITVESEPLAVEARGHQRHQDTRRPPRQVPPGVGARAMTTPHAGRYGR